jgi:cytoskeletal protein RodZ
MDSRRNLPSHPSVTSITQPVLASVPSFAYDYSHLDADGDVNPVRRSWPLGAFGEKLRKQREQRGIALDAISSITKISTRMLRALEDEHFDQLPGGVFNKGFVRAYARQVGLDEEEAITDYLSALRESQIQQQAILPDFRGTAGKPDVPVAPGNAGNDHGKQIQPEVPRQQVRREHDRSNDGRHRDELHRDESHHDKGQHDDRGSEHASASRDATVRPAGETSVQVPWGKLAAVLLLVTLILAFWNLRRHAGPKAAAMPVASQQQSSAGVAEPVSAATSSPPSSSAKSRTAGKPSTRENLSSGTMSAGTISTGTIPGETTSGKPTPPIATRPAANPAAPVSPPLAKITAPAGVAKEPNPFTLLIRAEKTTWISIVADGKPVTEETLIAPAHTSVRASHEIYLRAGNAAGVSFLLNGKEYPAQGNEGEVKTYIFDATGLRTTPQP